MTMTKRKIVRISIDTDPDAMGPKEWDGQWTLYSFNHRHATYKNPDSSELRIEVKDGKATSRNPGLRRKLETGLAFFLSLYEHSGHAWSLAGEGMQCRWDTSPLAGILVWENKPGDMGATREKDPKKRHQAREKDARSFLETWNAWENGENYGYSIEGDGLDENCGGFIGPDLSYMFQEIDGYLEGRENIAIVLEGDAKDIAEFHWKNMPETYDDEDDIEDDET